MISRIKLYFSAKHTVWPIIWRMGLIYSVDTFYSGMFILYGLQKQNSAPYMKKRVMRLPSSIEWRVTSFFVYNGNLQILIEGVIEYINYGRSWKGGITHSHEMYTKMWPKIFRPFLVMINKAYVDVNV